jgi:hypothetical protein
MENVGYAIYRKLYVFLNGEFVIRFVGLWDEWKVAPLYPQISGHSSVQLGYGPKADIQEFGFRKIKTLGHCPKLCLIRCRSIRQQPSVSCTSSVPTAQAQFRSKNQWPPPLHRSFGHSGQVQKFEVFPDTPHRPVVILRSQ